MPELVASVAGPWAFDDFCRMVALPLTVQLATRVARQGPFFMRSPKPSHLPTTEPLDARRAFSNLSCLVLQLF